MKTFLEYSKYINHHPQELWVLVSYIACAQNCELNVGTKKWTVPARKRCTLQAFGPKLF